MENGKTGRQRPIKANILKHWRAILLLCITLFLALFTGLRLAAVVSPPKPPETVSLQPVQWQANFTAGQGVTPNKELNATFQDACLMNFTTILGNIVPGPDYLCYIMPTGVCFNISPTNTHFRLTDASITISVTIGDSTVELLQPQPQFQSNLSTSDYALNGKDAYIHLTPAKTSAYSAFNDGFIWNIYHWNTNQLQIDFHITYYNGTTQETTTQPFILTLIGTF
jgi:hypothetical protein